VEQPYNKHTNSKWYTTANGPHGPGNCSTSISNVRISVLLWVEFYKDNNTAL